MKRSVILLASASCLVLATLAPLAASTADDGTAPDGANDRSLVTVTANAGTEPELETIQVRGVGQAASSSLTELDLAALRTYSRQSGEDLQAVIASQVGAEPFAALVYSLAKQNPTTYVSAGLGGESTKQPNAWVHFTERPGAPIVDRLAALPVDVEIRFGSKLSATSVENLASLAIEALHKHPDAVQPGTLEAGYNATHTGLEVLFGRAPEASDQAVEAAIENALAALELAGAAEIPIEFREQANATIATAEDTIKGGYQLTWNGTRNCSAGFSSRTIGTDALGTVTAKHCRNDLDFEFNDTTLNYVGAADMHPNGAHIDLQFHQTRSPHSTVKKFYSGDGEEKTVGSVGTATEGTVYCHFGWGSGTRRCSRVVATQRCLDYRWPIDGVTRRSCGLAITANDVSAGGDSGGPWFNGSQAIGSHAGATTDVRSFFTMVHKYEVSMHVRVLR